MCYESAEGAHGRLPDLLLQFLDSFFTLTICQVVGVRGRSKEEKFLHFNLYKENQTTSECISGSAVDPVRGEPDPGSGIGKTGSGSNHKINYTKITKYFISTFFLSFYIKYIYTNNVIVAS